VQRSGRNIGGYNGEVIDIQDVLRRIHAAAAAREWEREDDFLAFRRSTVSPRHRVYLSTGIHGDEPAGPLAMLQLVEEDQWPLGAALWICPCLNPAGFALNRRENAQGVDLNRDYRHLNSEEVRAHVRWLERQPGFDLTLCLHEDWESHGFYVYELNPDDQPPLAEAIVEAAGKVCPVDCSPTIEERPAHNGIIRLRINPAERPQWPEALYLITHKTRLSCTLEAPSDFALGTRVAALVAAVRAALERLNQIRQPLSNKP